MTLHGYSPTRLARNTDPMTSHAAAEQVEAFALSHEMRILKSLLDHGAMTVDEIARHTRLQSHQINKRLPELERKGLAQPTTSQKLSNSGRMERIWRAVRTTSKTAG